MRILQVVPYFPPAYAFGGPVKVVYEISRELVKMGNQVAVYTSDAKDLWTRINESSFAELDGIQVYYMKNLSMFSVKKSKLFITPEIVPRIEKEGRTFDIIHLHEYRTFQNVIVARYAKNHNIPYVLQAHGSLPRIASKQGLKWIYDVFFGFTLIKNASKIIALTTSEAQQYREMGVPKAKIEIIPNGIDLSKYAELPAKGTFRRKFNLNDTEKLVLYIGRINEIKGIDVLVRAFANLVKKLDRVKLVVVGADDGYLRELKALIKALKVEDKVIITGPLYNEDKLAAYLDSDLLVLPSRYETFPNVVLEAFACSKPVVASNVESIPDIVLDGQTGLIFQTCNPEELAEKILYVFAHPKEAKEMGYRARKLVEENFSSVKVVCSMEKLYRQVSQQK